MSVIIAGQPITSVEYEFTSTPTNISYLKSIVRHPVTGVWTAPIMTFNTSNQIGVFGDSYTNNNNSRSYQQRVLDMIYLRLVDKWLYSCCEQHHALPNKKYPFKKLLRYFKIEHTKGENDQVHVSLIKNLDDASKKNIKKRDRKFVFRYIERVFATPHFIEKALRKYVKHYNLNWHDLLYNIPAVQEYLAHKLQKLIVLTIKDLDKKATTKK